MSEANSSNDEEMQAEIARLRELKDRYLANANTYMGIIQSVSAALPPMSRGEVRPYAQLGAEVFYIRHELNVERVRVLELEALCARMLRRMEYAHRTGGSINPAELTHPHDDDKTTWLTEFRAALAAKEGR